MGCLFLPTFFVDLVIIFLVFLLESSCFAPFDRGGAFREIFVCIALWNEIQVPASSSELPVYGFLLRAVVFAGDSEKLFGHPFGPPNKKLLSAIFHQRHA
jgi:hypothetical protein